MSERGRTKGDDGPDPLKTGQTADRRRGTVGTTGSPARARLLFATLPGARPWRDAIAGLTLAAIAVPEQLATGRLAGVEPLVGLLAFIVAGLAYAVFGRDATLSVGADSTIAPVFAGSVAAAALSAGAAPVQVAATLAVMVGGLLIAIRALRLSWIADLLSVPVGAGLLTGIAVHILIGRLPDLLALPAATGSLASVAGAVLAGLGNADPLAFGIGLAVAGLCALGSRHARRAPVPLLALGLATAAAHAFDPAGSRLPRLGTGAGPLEWNLPAVPTPDLMVGLLPVALTVAFLCIAQTVAVEQGMRDSGGGTDHGRDDIVAVGAANVLSGLAGAFPVNASPPRSEIVRAAGGQSQLASLVAVGIAVLALARGWTVISAVPQAALAGVLVFVAFRILPVPILRRILARSPSEIALAGAAAGLVIALPIQTGAALAIVLGLVHAAAPSMWPEPVELFRVPGTTVWWRRRRGEPGERVPGVLVFGLGAPLNFVTMPRILSALDAALKRRQDTPKLVVLEAAGVLAVDLSGAEMLSRRVASLRELGTDVVLARLESVRAAADAERAGLISALGPDRVFLTVDEAVRALASGPERGTTGSGAGQIRPQNPD